MNDFKMITRAHILEAIKKYNSLKENKLLNNDRESILYDLIYEGKAYPHKYILGIAFGIAANTDKDLESSKYTSQKAEKVLKKLQFEIKKKNFFVLGSTWDKADKTAEFINGGYWESGFDDNSYKSDLDKIDVGDLVALKSSYVKSTGLPFENNEKPVSVMLIKAIGKVISNPKNGKKLYIDYKKDFKPKEIYGFTYRHTVRQINKEKWQDEIGWIFTNNKQNNYYLEKYASNSDTGEVTVINQPLNQILYGPPGTGKTYNTIDKALQIIDGEVPTNREEAKERFEALKEDGQIEFVTFHQSYGYEEFVEGIKAIVPGKEGNDSDEMIYDVSPGIFRKISKKALSNYSPNSTDIFEVKSFELNAKSLNIQAKMIQDDENTYRVQEGSKIRKDEAPSFSQYNYSTLRNTVLKKAKLKEESEFYILQEDYDFQSMSAASSVILGRMSNGLRDWKEIINYDVNVKNNKKYILIIDEINRGNISKIFGELITLIEESKRLGNDEVMEVTLPYSGEKFGVPKNLYIIGTMNTADRSIALMDTALRRRFEFKEMMPKPELLDVVEGIDLNKLLVTINKRIEYLYDRDHTIGHAYFIDIKDKIALDSTMRNKVIPLLQEYFYDDWEKIQLVLNDGFIERTTQDASKLFDTIDDEYIEDDKYVYSIASHFTLESYIKIYAKIEQNEVGE